MRKLFIADLYRLFRGIGIYITLFILFALSTLIVTARTTDAVGNAYYGAETIQVILNGMSNMIHLMLVLAIFVSGSMFANGILEKKLATRISRTKIYLSSLALSSTLGVIFIVGFIAWAVILGTALRGFGSISQGFWFERISILGVQMILLLALNALATFLVFTFKRTKIVIGMFFALLIAPRMVEAFSVLSAEPVQTRAFDIVHNIVLAAQLPTLYSYQIIQALTLGVGVIVLTTFVGIVCFKLSAYKISAISIACEIHYLAVYLLKNRACKKAQLKKQTGVVLSP